MEKVSYDEAREWFWIRTWLWFLVTAIVTMIALFGYSGDLIKAFSSRFWFSLGVGIALPLMGLLAATLSRQMPWMRTGWRRGFAVNSPVCAAISAAVAFFACGIILSFLQNDVNHPPSAETIQAAYALMQFGIAVAALWGFVYGAWFALRKDKYFVEPI